MVCGCEVLVIVAIPAAFSAWPAVLAAATSAASALGFMAAQEVIKEKQSEAQVEQTVPEVALDVTQGEEVTKHLASGQEIHFQNEGVDLVFSRDSRGRAGVRVRGMGKTRQELEAIGQAFCQKLAQHYAYHRVMTKLRQQHFQIVGEDVKDSDTVHIQARIYRDED